MTMRGFATALGPHGITCNAVAPGMILTDMTRHHWEKPGPAKHIKKRVPVGRIGTPTDVGHAVVFLASPEAEYINGMEGPTQAFIDEFIYIIGGPVALPHYSTMRFGAVSVPPAVVQSPYVKE